MARNALQALGDLGLPGADSLIFISDEADDRAEVGRGNGLGPATSTAVAGFGLEIAPAAPGGASGEPNLPDSVPDGAGPSSLAGIEPFGTVFAAKGGSKGKPPKDDSGSGSPILTARYISGDDDTYLDGGSGLVDVDNYNIQIDFYGDLWLQDYHGVSYDLGEAFVAVANFLSSIIAEGANDVYDFLGNLVYDDLVIEAYIIDIDGAGGVLGRAGPTGIRTSDGLPATGVMEFDVADAVVYAELNLWDDLVFHEMMHVLGFGTLWDYNNLLETTSVLIDDNGTKKPTDDVYETTITFTGTEAKAAAAAAGLGDTLYVEQDGGSGTAGGHWDELVFADDGTPDYTGGYDNEIMTGFIDKPTNYLSPFSVATLADIGYTLVSLADGSVDYADLASPLSTEIVLDSEIGFAELLVA